MEEITDLRKLQIEEISILDEFTRICEENDFKYYSLGGTLLGSIRHKGFIPWDDDVDVAMPRSDYEKFLSLSKEKFNKGFELVTYKNDKNYRYPWARLITKNMKIINHMANIPREEYAWIDIIPLDGFPNLGIKRKMHKLHLSFWWNLNQIIQFDELVDQKRKRSKIGKLSLKISSMFKWLGKVIDYKICLNKLNKVLMKYPYEMESQDIINFLAAYGFKETFSRESFSDSVNYEFEGRNIKGPKGYDDVLKTIYGDYMKLPPLEERNKHHAEIVTKKENKKMINFTVGPVQSNEMIRKIGSNQVPYFRTSEFSNVMFENESLIKKFADAEEEAKVVFITGSGTASMEAAIANTLTSKDKALVVNGGSFGKRFVELCELYEIKYDVIELEVGQNLTEEILRKYENKGYTVFLINMHETSTGVLYDMKLVGDFCKRNNMFLITDCISSFLADEYSMKNIGADVMITGSQKALACPPGISIIVLSKKAIDRVQENDVKCLYLNLKNALKNAERGQTPFTPAVGILLQINERLIQIEKNGGVEEERKKIKNLADDFRSKILKERLPFEFVTDSKSNAVTSLYSTKVSANDIFITLKDEYGIWVCPNGGELKDKVFRVGHIGDLTIEDNDKLINAFKDMRERKLL